MSSLTQKSISFKNLQSLRVDSRYVFAVILLVIFALEAKVVQGELATASGLRDKVEQLPAHASTARVNFTDYNWAVDRIEKSKAFQPSGGPTKNPFGAPPQ